MSWDQIPDDEVIRKTAEALKGNGIEARIAANGEEAKRMALELIPKGSEVMTMTSRTLDTIGLAKELNESGEYGSIRHIFGSMDQSQKKEMNRLGAGPDYAVGSVHAVTQDGRILIASATGSQLPAYAYAAMNVIWVVGAQKIVEDIDQAFRRLKEYTFPKEDERAMQAYGTHSGINKTLVINKEAAPKRLTMILVKENLGF